MSDPAEQGAAGGDVPGPPAAGTESGRALTQYYDIGKKLGKGSYAVVHQCVNKRTSEEFAVKIISKEKSKEKRLKSEVALMQKVDHPNCVKLYDVFEDASQLCLVLDLLTGGTVMDRILESEHYGEREAASAVADVLNALQYLHDMNITHRDLKPENLLYSSSDPDSEHYNTIKLVDFGLAKLTENAQTALKTTCGTPYFLAPEIIDNATPTYGAEVDIWAMGVLVFFMLCGYYPFDDESIPVMFRNIKKGRYEFTSPYWDGISVNAKLFIREMLHTDASKRPTAMQCLDHPWISNASEGAANKLHSSHRSFLLIQKMPIFQRMEAGCLQEVSRRLKVIRVDAQEVLFKAGQEGDSMYFVNSGVAQVLVDGMEIDRKRVGGFFGETALVLSSKRTATVKSLGSNAYAGHNTEAAEFFQLSRADFEAVIEKYPVLKSRLNTIAEDNMKRVKKAQNSMMFKLKSSFKNITGACLNKS